MIYNPGLIQLILYHQSLGINHETAKQVLDLQQVVDTT